MNNQQSNDLYEKFNSELTVIEKDMAEIAQMAATVSEKFNGIRENIQSFASIPGFGRKGVAAATIIGGAVKLFGGLYADVKKEEALQKLLPKKIELAELKTMVIQNYAKILEGQKGKFRALLEEEISFEFSDENRATYQEGGAESCQNSYNLYVRTMHVLEICRYMLAEFAAWKTGKHESGESKPDKAVVLEDVLAMITTPEDLCNPNNNKLTGGMYLLSKNEPLFATLLQKLHIDTTATEKKKESRVAKRKSFSEVKKFIRQLKKIENSKEVTHLEWLKSLPTFQHAIKASSLTTLQLYLFKYYSIGYLIFFTLFGPSMENDLGGRISSSIIPALLVAAIAVIFSLMIFYVYENDNGGRGLGYYFLFLLFTVLTLGLMPIVFKRYLKKEKNYEDFLVQLKVTINQ
ncbi:hypothetical protein V6B16_14015 [Salinimicrobium catena]|uniref:hypothetical protein n=1 Tax=Salinimicrobium catena TaxID=390640 RepID=UPI002FE49239